jgi:hypothetical protein
MDESLTAWVTTQQAEEAKRLASEGARILPLSVVSLSVRVQIPEKQPKSADKRRGAPESLGRVIVNVVEFGTAFDFNKITNIFLSPSKACDVRAGWRFVHVALKTASDTAPIFTFGYVYNRSEYKDNALTHWCLRNSKGLEVVHVVDHFEEITDETEATTAAK